MSDAADSFLRLLRDDGLVHSPGAKLTPLPGGVSSEIYRVDGDGDTFVVKRALAKLKVQDDWAADVSRNTYERRYLEYAGRVLPGSVPMLRKTDPASRYFAMEYFGPEFRNWKETLLAGSFDPTQAGAAGRILGRIHRLSFGDPQAATLFNSLPCFKQLRLEPYLLTTGRRHPELEEIFVAEVQRLAGTSECLVHGDFSPKNLLFGGDRMVLLDCEAAWYGDPAFDVCFLLNHLFLKSLFHSNAKGLAPLVRTFWEEYMAAAFHTIEERVPRLLLMLLLARIDGKSPVEYLKEPQKDFVRRFVHAQLPRPPVSLFALSDAWFREMMEPGGKR
ncbi:MAG TPA: aminoglycoside phosphotransferase family protein [Bryobacteraceae bacterium]|nr:aminoglycoside phosphotransferase family protein [Bryobacteraceae bacterium]